MTNHFASKTTKQLARKGIAVIGATVLPDANGSFANGETAYQINDNGTHRVVTFAQVIALAGKEAK